MLHSCALEVGLLSSKNVYVYVVKGSMVVADVLFRGFARRLDPSFRICRLYVHEPIRVATLAGGNLRGF
jgi:hypothetical protein